MNQTRIAGPFANNERIKQELCKAVDEAEAGAITQFVYGPVKRSRTAEQNRLQFLWYKEAELQGDQTSPEYRAECKLHFGVPILRAEDEEFRNIYDKVIRPLPYDCKLAMMREPIDFPVTSRMTVKQLSNYLNQVQSHFQSIGFELTEPEVA